MCRSDLVLIDGIGENSELLSFSLEIDNPLNFQMGQRGPARSLNSLALDLMEFSTALQIPIPPSLSQFTNSMFIVDSISEKTDHLDYNLVCESVVIEVARGIHGITSLSLHYCPESENYSVARGDKLKYLKCYLCDVNVRSIEKHITTKKHIRLCLETPLSTSSSTSNIANANT